MSMGGKDGGVFTFSSRRGAVRVQGEGREREGRERGEGGGTHLGHVRDGVPAHRLLDVLRRVAEPFRHDHLVDVHHRVQPHLKHTQGERGEGER